MYDGIYKTRGQYIDKLQKTAPSIGTASTNPDLEVLPYGIKTFTDGVNPVVE